MHSTAKTLPFERSLGVTCFSIYIGHSFSVSRVTVLCLPRDTSMPVGHTQVASFRSVCAWCYVAHALWGGPAQAQLRGPLWNPVGFPAARSCPSLVGGAPDLNICLNTWHYRCTDMVNRRTYPEMLTGDWTRSQWVIWRSFWSPFSCYCSLNISWVGYWRSLYFCFFASFF